MRASTQHDVKSAANAMQAQGEATPDQQSLRKAKHMQQLQKKTGVCACVWTHVCVRACVCVRVCVGASHALLSSRQ